MNKNNKRSITMKKNRIVIVIVGLIITLVTITQLIVDITYSIRIDYLDYPNLAFDIAMFLAAVLLLSGEMLKREKVIISSWLLFLSSMIITLFIDLNDFLYDEDLPRYIYGLLGILPVLGIIVALMVIYDIRKQKELGSAISVITGLLWMVWGVLTQHLGCCSVIGMIVLMKISISLDGCNKQCH